ncbi:MAG: ribose-5-phosphate isomerase RpiA [Rhizobiales bacterium]|nr:ribose-5-phosphate isomerase RpiA [Hyphomicrobiales bacterium]MBI3672690.1 ribose-5-phosphate isomerase RpiA [Hyphomicrobiales bacterium]
MTADQKKHAAAEAALTYVKPGMKLGLGTGSTAAHFIDLVGARVRAGLDVACVPTSETTRHQAERAGIPLTTLDQHPFLDLAVDGADEFDDKFNLIKGGGGALLAEKIVASSSRYMIVIADDSKKVDTLGRFPLPVEVVPFGVKATAWKIERALKICGLTGKLVLRTKAGQPFRTDGGHAIVDVSIGRIADPARLSDLLSVIPGVVDHGLFIGICGIVLMGTDAGVKTFRKS